MNNLKKIKESIIAWLEYLLNENFQENVTSP